MIIEIPGNPIAKQRHRHSNRNGFVHVYDPQEKEKIRIKNMMKRQIIEECNSPYKDIIMEASRVACGELFNVSLEFHMPFKKSINQGALNQFSWIPTPAHSKPDLDNLEKFILDCGNGVLWRDDCQIVSLSSKKFYSQNPKTVIKITARQNMQLSEKATAIISCISSQEFQEFIDDINDYLIDVQDPYIQDFDDDDPCLREIRSEAAAYLLSKIADKYGAKIEKIRKKHSDYWQNECKNTLATLTYQKI